MKNEIQTWVKFGNAFVERDEVYSLAGCMGGSLVEAAGYIALVVAYALAVGDDDGCVDDLTDKAIERACFWYGERGALVEHFITSGIFCGDRNSDTNPLRIAPALWADVAADTIRKRADARQRKRNQRERDKLKDA